MEVSSSSRLVHEEERAIANTIFCLIKKLEVATINESQESEEQMHMPSEEITDVESVYEPFTYDLANDYASLQKAQGQEVSRYQKYYEQQGPKELEEVECDVDVRSRAEVAKVREVESNGEMLNDAEEAAVDDSDDMDYRSEIRVFVAIKNDADVVMEEEGSSVRENNHSVQEDEAAVTWVNISPVIEGIDRDDINLANEEKENYHDII
ncbi:uncharacterized protein LOC126355463 [Schistocerca gregaria]|uniref:uncharacterized protein LOC126355463 n=1 Tax=Schistocerca gregaria TaxID=7010 RepID=UPI00211EFBA1|nr:uncharacterized protein LOC126355463 [Schistocerca gregaria]